MSRNVSTPVEDEDDLLDPDTEVGATGRPVSAANVAVPVGRRGRTSVEKKRRLGSYRIVALLGQGGMAQVHLALKHGPGGFTKLLVVKSMLEELDDPIYEASFMHEARLAAQLSHPNVVQTYEVGEHEGRPFIAMEYVEGQTMRAVQRRIAPARLPLGVQLRIIAETARGLHHAHQLKNFTGAQMGIVHRDVSPQNIMLSYDGQIKLLDFGIAKASDSGELTRDGMIKGKIDYMAPEQLRGEGIDHRADVFALGVMLWEALTGKRFSGGAEVAEVTKMHNRLIGKEPKLRDVAPDTPMRLVEICEKAIALESKDRWDSAEEFAQSINDYMKETSKSSESRDLASQMATLFAAERKNMRDLIEEQIRIMSSPELADEDLVVPVIPPLEGNTGTPLSRSDEFPRIQRQLEPQEPESTQSSVGTKAAVVLVAVVLALGGVYFVQQRSAQQVVANTAPAVAPPAVAVAPPTNTASEAAATVQLHIDGSPEEAVAELDGAAIDLPFDAQLIASDHPHRIVLRAPGYFPQERTFTLAANTRIRLDLDPEPSNTAGRRAAAARRAQLLRAGDMQATTATTTQTAAPTTTATPPVTQTATAPADTTPMRARPAVDSANPYE